MRQLYEKAAALSGTNETSTLSEESGRKITTRVSPGSALDIQDGVTKIDTSAIWTPVTDIDFSSHHDTMIENADGSQVPMDQPYFTSEQIAPEIIPTGQRMGYTVDGFPVTYTETTSASSN